jgi:hypothetical protein
VLLSGIIMFYYNDLATLLVYFQVPPFLVQKDVIGRIFKELKTVRFIGLETEL